MHIDVAVISFKMDGKKSCSKLKGIEKKKKQKIKTENDTQNAKRTKEVKEVKETVMYCTFNKTNKF